MTHDFLGKINKDLLLKSTAEVVVESVKLSLGTLNAGLEHTTVLINQSTARVIEEFPDKIIEDKLRSQVYQESLIQQLTTMGVTKEDVDKLKKDVNDKYETTTKEIQL